MSEATKPRRSRAEEIIHLLNLLSRVRGFRYASLAFTALSIVATIQGIGGVADWIVRHWRPITDFLDNGLGPYMKGLDNVLGPPSVVFFFSPFIAEGLVDGLRRDKAPPPILINLAAIFAFYTLTAFFSQRPDKLGWDLLGQNLETSALIAVATMPIYLATMFLCRRRGWATGEKFSLALIASVLFGSFSIAGALLMPSMFSRSYILRDILSGLLFGLPLLAPRRIVEVAAAVLTIVALSLAYERLGSMLGN